MEGDIAVTTGVVGAKAVGGEGLDWRTAGAPAGAVAPMRIVGRFRKARRCIDPPRLELTRVSGAAEYEVVITTAADPERSWTVRSAGPEVGLAAIWAELPFEALQIAIRARGADGGLVGVGPVSNLRRSPDWSGPASEALDYVAAARGVIDYLVHRVPNAPAHPDLPGYMWHAAAASAGDGFATDLQFPALSYPSLIGLFLAGHEAGIGDDLGVDLLARCRRLADHLIDHPAVADGPLAGVPLTTMGQDGTGGLFEPDRITLLRLGWTGRTMLALTAATGEPRYAEYARRLGQILLDFQREDGSWPYRVRLSDGAVLEPYSAAAVMALLLFEQLEGDEYAAALERGLAWTLANPVQTGLWQQMYEDVRRWSPTTTWSSGRRWRRRCCCCGGAIRMGSGWRGSLSATSRTSSSSLGTIRSSPRRICRSRRRCWSNTTATGRWTSTPRTTCGRRWPCMRRAARRSGRGRPWPPRTRSCAARGRTGVSRPWCRTAGSASRPLSLTGSTAWPMRPTYCCGMPRR